MIAVVKGNIHAGFRGGVEQALALRIFANGIQKSASAIPFSNARPGFSVIAGAEEIRLVVVEAMAVDGGVGGRRRGSATLRCA